MKVEIDVPAYDANKGMQYQWTNLFDIGIRIENGAVLIEANKEGLLSLANHLLNLAQDGIPAGHHMHFDADNSLNDGSSELFIQKK
ncbi:Imm32 family immunity protein [Undibacterium sp. Ji83W]|uniref:Imm32 family immunity protein n=1 Tax=Undibacterium sp. Ji83W TaxID=3413043 RepID=UPI003BF22790